MKAKRHIIISLDAVGTQDFHRLLEMEGLGTYLQGGAYCDRVETIYPSLTYPAHCSIVTGQRPSKHGVIDNTLIQPNRKTPDWYWYRKYIRSTTFYDEYINQGKKVASLLWPVTARSRIQYDMPEIFANRWYTNQLLTSVRNGNPFFQAKFLKKHGHLIDGVSQPALDNFVTECLLDTIREQKADLIMVHFTDVDTNKHIYGIDTHEIKESLLRHNHRICRIVETLKEEGLFEDTNIILLGDHSQKNIHFRINPNYLFVQKGWITYEDGVVKDWKVYGKSCDGSLYVYLKKDKKGQVDARLKEEVYQYLKSLVKDEVRGIAGLLTKRSICKLGADENCEFMLEAKEDFYFGEACNIYEEDVTTENSDYHKEFHFGCHGYLPQDSSYHTFFFAYGPSFAKNVVVPKMEIIDDGPTIAKMLGVTLPEAEGRVIEEFFKGEE